MDLFIYDVVDEGNILGEKDSNSKGHSRSIYIPPGKMETYIIAQEFADFLNTNINSVFNEALELWINKNVLNYYKKWQRKLQRWISIEQLSVSEDADEKEKSDTASQVSVWTKYLKIIELKINKLEDTSPENSDKVVESVINLLFEQQPKRLMSAIFEHKMAYEIFKMVGEDITAQQELDMERGK
ncbi:MAG: hypothetical protein JSU85_01745 [Candidatus Zixiibacteriota bacterium]|nr:MAG: hypothetical protein JSU85_01745 [candidate division Zixibacteria bacterium]